MERRVLLGIEYFKQCRSGIALKVGTNFVYLIEYKDRIALLGFGYGLHNAAGHSTYIGATVTTYLGLIVKTAQRNAHILTMNGTCYTLTQRCFTYSGRAVKTQNRSMREVGKFHHSKMLNDAFFDLFESIMVFIENGSGLLEVYIVLAILIPGQVEDVVEIAILYRVIGGLGMESFQLTHLFFKDFSYIFTPEFLSATIAQLLHLLFYAIASQLLLDSAYLLLQEVLTLLLVDTLSCL